MSREQPPNRRRSVTHKVEFRGQTYFIGIGLDARGFPLDVFGSSAKLTSDMDFLVRDACIVVSLAMQFGARPADLQRSLQKVPEHQIVEGEVALVDAPASLVGAIVDVLLAEEVFAAGLAGDGEAPDA